ncbi:unnamed protein product [Ixodes hexagonus]
MPRVKKVVAGFYTDMNMLLEKFMAENTVRYVDFAGHWRNHKFSLIFCGRKDQRELRYMIEEMMPIILKLWIPTSSFPEKVFALYMLYAVYEVQPIEHKLKIRVKLSHWNMMEDILQQSKKEQHLDICYIIYRMRVTSSFHFVAFLKHRSPARLTELEDDINSTAEVGAKVFADLERLVKDDLLKQLSMIHNQYTSMKAVQEHPGVKQLDMVKENIFDDMNREVTVLQAKYRAVREAEQNRQSGESCSDDEDALDVGARRKRLRERQFANKPNTRQGTRFEELLEREENLCVDTSPGPSPKERSPSPAAERPSRKKGRPSKKPESVDPPSERPTAQDATSQDQPEAAASGSSRASKRAKRSAPKTSDVERSQPGN